MVVTINYHAGTFQTVKEPVQIWFREMTPDWKVVENIFMAEVDTCVGTLSGTVTLTFPLEGVKPSAQLPQGHFYYLFTECYYTHGKTVNTGLYPIRITSAFPIESVSVVPEADTMYVDSTLSLSAVLHPENTDEPSIIWTSSTTSIATVDQNGVVTAHSSGRVHIGATAEANNTIFGLATIEVIENEEEHVSSEDHPGFHSKGVLIYPNPVYDGSIRISGLDPGTYRLSVFNLLGTEVQNRVLTVYKEVESIVKLNGLKEGIYVMLMKGTGNEIRSHVITIEK
jgi:hypothetical protein